MFAPLQSKKTSAQSVSRPEGKACTSAQAAWKHQEQLVQLMHRSSAKASVPTIQCLMTGQEFFDLALRNRGDQERVVFQAQEDLLKILRSLDAYQQIQGISTHAFQERLRLLDEVEHLIYHWHSWHIKGREEEAALFTEELLQLLVEVQKEHQEVVKEMVRRKIPIWVKEQETMLEDLKERIDKLWSGLIEGTSPGLRIEGLVDEKYRDLDVRPFYFDFKYEILAHLARLISRPVGRTLVEELAGVGFRVDILPLPISVSSFAETCPREPLSLAFVIQEQGRIRRNSGNASYINFPRKMSDIEISAYTMERDHYCLKRPDTEMLDHTIKGVRCTLLPMFVVLGHELGHCKNNRAGMNRRYMNRRLFKHFPKCFWTSVEEEVVILELENMIREEHGLPLRRYHCSERGDWLYKKEQETEV